MKRISKGMKGIFGFKILLYHGLKEDARTVLAVSSLRRPALYSRYTVAAQRRDATTWPLVALGKM